MVWAEQHGFHLGGILTAQHEIKQPHAQVQKASWPAPAHHHQAAARLDAHGPQTSLQAGAGGEVEQLQRLIEWRVGQVHLLIQALLNLYSPAIKDLCAPEAHPGWP